MHWFVVLGLLGACRFGFEERTLEPDEGTLEIRVSAHISEQAPTTAIAGAVVWSTRIDGEIDDVQRTDLEGRATLRIQAGGTASAYDAESMWLTTFVGAEPGDVLEAGLLFPLCIPTPIGSVTIDWATPVPAPASVATVAGCFESTAAVPPLALQVDPGVTAPFDLMLRALDGDGELIASATKVDATFSDGAMHTFAMSDWTAPVQRSFGFTGLADFEGIESQLSTRFSTPNTTVPNAMVKQTVTAVTAGSMIATQNIPADVTRMSSIAAIGATSEFPESALLVAQIDEPIGVATPTTMPPVPGFATWDGARMSWELETGEIDAVDVLAGFYDDTDTLLLVWSLRASPTTTTVEYPAIPPELVMPDVSRLTAEEHYLVLDNYAIATDYRTARQLGEGGDPLIALFSGVPNLTKYTGSYAVSIRGFDEGTQVAPRRLFGRLRR